MTLTRPTTEHKAPVWRGAASAATLTLLGLGAATALSGCSSSQAAGDSTSEPSVSAISRLTSTDTFMLPLDQFAPSAEDGARVQAAYRVRLRQCVAGFGLEFATQTAPSQPPALGPNARRYGVTDAETAAAYGYRVAPEPATQKPPPKRLSTEVETVLSGKGQSTINGKPVPAGGCVAKAQNDINGGPATVDDSLADRLSRESFSRSEADSRTRAALARWSTCMKAKGFDYATPDSAVGDPGFATSAVTKVEISTAKADIVCKEQTNLVGIWAAVEMAYQQRIIAANQSALAALRQMHDAQVKIAAVVLSTPQ